MTYLLGFVGMLQAILLPGLCLTVSLRGWNWTQRFLFAAPFSLLLNYYLVWGLATAGLYSQVSIFLVFLLELGWIFYRARKNPAAKVDYAPLTNLAELIVLLLATAALTKYSDAWVRAFGDIFQMWDAVASWNPWGRDWFHGLRPAANLYPHALPISFSLPYAFMGSAEIETFSKAGIGLLFLAAIGCLIELGFRRRDIRLLAWVTAAIFPTLLARFLQSHWVSGYADAPLATMLVFAFAVSFFPGPATPWLFGLLAGASALVKQPGLFFAGMSPLLLGKFKNFSTYAKVAGGAALAAGLWYAFIFVSIYVFKKDASNVGYLANLIPGGPLHRWGVSWSLVVYFAGVSHLLVYGALALLGCVVSKDARRWLLLLGIPYSLIWATFFGYDNRNIAMALFPWALAAAGGVAFLLNWVVTKFPRLLRLPVAALTRPAVLGRAILAITLVLALISTKRPIKHWLNHGSLRGWENEQRLSLGDDPRANKLFTRLAACEPTARFLTNYQWLTMIPQLEKSLQFVECEKIREAILRREDAYVFLNAGICDLGKDLPPAFYKNDPFFLFSILPRESHCAD